jgi:cholesterol transport system auxiliary component
MKIIAKSVLNTPAIGQFGFKICRYTVLGACTVALLACNASLPQAPASKTVYDFGPALVAAPISGAAPSTAKPIAVLDVQAISALSGTAMLYRLGYANPQQLLPYSAARWSMPPAQLVQQHLVQQLGQSRMVLSAANAGGAPQLQLELQEFSHYFDSPTRSKALLRLRATLLDTHGKELSQRSFASEPAAAAADAAGGAAALAQASSSVAQQIQAWLAQ